MIIGGVFLSEQGGETCGLNAANPATPILEITYGLSITALPFLLIAFINCLILKKLAWCTGSNRIKKKANRIRLEFTMIILVVSTCFVGLNLPYFVVWSCYRVIQLQNNYFQFDIFSGQLHIAKTLFYSNYCVKFFLYCVTGAYYRRELWVFFRTEKENERRRSLSESSVHRVLLRGVNRLNNNNGRIE